MSYALAGEFSAFLITKYGLDTYLSLYSALAPDSNKTTIANSFMEHLGESLDKIITDFEAGAQCPHAAYDAKVIECAAEPLLWDGSSLQLKREMSCEDSDVVGPFTGDRTILLRTLEVTQDGLYTLSLECSNDRAAFSMLRCGTCNTRILQVNGVSSIETRLETGRYAVRLHGSSLEKTRLSVTLTRTGP